MEPTANGPDLLQRLIDVLPKAVYVVDLASRDPQWKLWFDVIVTLVTLGATLGVASLAVLGMRRASRAERTLRHEAEAKRRSIDSRLSAEAYALRGVLFTWLRKSPMHGDTLPVNRGRDDLQAWAAAFLTYHPDVDARMIRMMSLAADASPQVRTAFTRVFATYYVAYATSGDAVITPSTDELANRIAMAEHAIRSCIDTLKQVVGEPLESEAAAYVSELGLAESAAGKATKLRERLKEPS
jgi:hypothetical protein